LSAKAGFLAWITTRTTEETLYFILLIGKASGYRPSRLTDLTHEQHIFSAGMSGFFRTFLPIFRSVLVMGWGPEYKKSSPLLNIPDIFQAMRQSTERKLVLVSPLYI
jgi:hypothetical protein